MEPQDAPDFTRATTPYWQTLHPPNTFAQTQPPITSPDAHKRLYLDPHLLPRVQGRRVVLMDDTISTGQTIAAALALAQQVGAEVSAVVWWR